MALAKHVTASGVISAHGGGHVNAILIANAHATTDVTAILYNNFGYILEL